MKKNIVIALSIVVVFVIFGGIAIMQRYNAIEKGKRFQEKQAREFEEFEEQRKQREDSIFHETMKKYVPTIEAPENVSSSE